MKRATTFILFLSFIFYPIINSANNYTLKKKVDINRAQQTLDSLYKYYSVDKTTLLRENYPFADAERVSYLASQADRTNKYSYLWPYSGTFSAVNALYFATKKRKYLHLLDKKVLIGLEEYYDTKREPYAYASYIRAANVSDRFYDDNIWIGIDFTDLYLKTRNIKYLDKAKSIWKFIESGMDDRLGGGIYWCEQKRHSKNACSNAPASVYALKLFIATSDSSYLKEGKTLYCWTKSHLQDRTDKLYYDNISLNGDIGKAKYAYNSGQMLQSAALLYRITKEEKYLAEARQIAQACYNHFFIDDNNNNDHLKILKDGDVWFTAVMLRGFIELYRIDGHSLYIDAFDKTLNIAWNHARKRNGLFDKDYKGQKKDSEKWLLTQAAFIEMYARLAAL